MRRTPPLPDGVTGQCPGDQLSWPPGHWVPVERSDGQDAQDVAGVEVPAGAVVQVQVLRVSLLGGGVGAAVALVVRIGNTGRAEQRDGGGRASDDDLLQHVRCPSDYP